MGLFIAVILFLVLLVLIMGAEKAQRNRQWKPLPPPEIYDDEYRRAYYAGSFEACPYESDGLPDPTINRDSIAYKRGYASGQKLFKDLSRDPSLMRNGKLRSSEE